MKTTLKLVPALLTVMLMISCQDKIEETYKINSPVYMSYDELRSSLKVAEPEDIIQPGKIYFKDDFIFINEYQKGIHVVYNADPSKPVVIKFIEIPGNVDMSIKGTMLYADSYVDLVTLDISDIDNIIEVDRDTNVFPYVLPAIDYPEGPMDQIDESKGIVVGYKVVEKTEKIESSNSNYGYYPAWRNFATEDLAMVSYSGAPSSGVSNSGIGVGGSMARFTLYNNSLYLLHESNLKIYDVSEASDPLYTREIAVGWGIETLFPYENKLFIGSQTGMLIYSLENPFDPSYISSYSHVTSCDPVVVEGNYAYVTLRGGNLCGAVSSQLNVIDLSNIQNPKLVSSFSMEEPYGLGIDNAVLFVCDGGAGLKIYDAKNPLTVNQNLLASYPDINAFDVIPLGDVLVMIGADGLYQYDYYSIENIRQLSHIPIYATIE